MGNRAVITTKQNFENDGVGIYLHWNGGRDSVQAFLKYCELQGYREPSTDKNDKTYTVKKGDTLSKIAAHFGVSVADLVKWNNIEDPDVILIGQKINLFSPVEDAVVVVAYIGVVIYNYKSMKQGTNNGGTHDTGS